MNFKACFLLSFLRSRPKTGRSADSASLAPPPPARAVKLRRFLPFAFGVVVSLLAYHLASAGLAWSLHFHPDELAICRWSNIIRRDGFIVSRAYPTGWFELYRIRMWLDRQQHKWAENWARHSVQDGRIVAADVQSFPLCPVETTPEVRTFSIQDGRNFNAWLYVLTALFLYAACLEARFHPLAAFLSTLFFLSAPAPLEFVHYCETDAGLLVSMAFFAWVAARAIRRNSLPWALFGAFVAGFAVSCKFTLFPLLLWCLLAPFVIRPRPSVSLRRWLPLSVALIVAALLLAFGGYLLGTPAFRAAPAWYLEKLQRASMLTYREIHANLGGDYSWSRATALRIRSMRSHLAQIGPLPLLWGFFSWAFWFHPRFRRQLPGLPILLPIFFPFLVFSCPFVRRQEMLPLSLLFAMGAALPLQWLLSRPAASPPLSRRTRWAVAAAALLALAALTAQSLRAASTLSCFLLRDTRAEVQNWFADSLPASTPIWFDAYVAQTARGVDCIPTSCEGLPFLWSGELPSHDGPDPLYYVENIGFEGRHPIRDPAAHGALFPHVLQSLANFRRLVYPVKTWAVASSAQIPTFTQPPVRLLSFEPPDPDAFDVPLAVSRPLLLLPYGTRLYDTAGPAGPGPLRAIRTVGKRFIVHPTLEDGPRWLVTRMLDGSSPVPVVREGLFSPAKSTLSPNGAVAAALRPSLWERFLARGSAFPASRIRMRGDDQSTFCASFFTPSAAEAALQLRLSGDPAAALDLLRAASPLNSPAQVEAFLAAAALHIPPDPSWIQSARDALAAADRLAATRSSHSRTAATLCGVPLGVLSDFSRIRLQQAAIVPGTRLPVFLPPGTYSLSLRFDLSAPPDLPSRLFASQSSDFVLASLPDEPAVLTASLTLTAPAFLALDGDSDAPAYPPFSAALELTWSPVDFTLAAADALRAALDTPSNQGALP